VAEVNMAAEKKRAVEKQMELLEKNEVPEEFEDDNDSSNDSEEFDDDVDSDAEAMEGINQEVNVEFEAREAQDSDFHGVRKLLQQLFLKASVNISDLTDTILTQNYVGSVIKQSDILEDDEEDMGDDDEVFGVISVVNITEKKDNESHKLIKKYVLDKCKECSDAQTYKTFEETLCGESQIGLLLSERFINIPPQIAPPMYDSLIKDIDKANKNKMKYNFDYYLMFIKTYRMTVYQGMSKKKKKGQGVLQTTYVNVEEEFFVEEADLKFEYSVEHEHDSVVDGKWDDEDNEMKPYRTVILLKADKLNTVVTKTRDEFSQ
ncbi:unnamed protein product, partial [Owenia fusiformis]